MKIIDATECPHCGSKKIRWIGYGSEYLEGLNLAFYSRTYRCNGCDSYWREQFIGGVQ